MSVAALLPHFLRPQWLWLLPALPLLFFVWRKKRQRANAWRDAVDAHLLPHLLEGATPARRFGFASVAVAWTLAAFALAGPSWRQSEQALWQSKQPLVIALDVSSASNAGDMQPSRLLQARAKLAALFDARGGELALVAFAGDAFTVAPLTDDARNLALFLDALDPSVMPVDGQDAARAIALSARLLKQAGFARGDILLLTDHADDAAFEAASNAWRAGYRVSALGLGSARGAAYQTADGRIAQARLDASSLRALVSRGGGSYEALGAGDADLRALGVLDAQTAAQQQQHDGKNARLAWQDDGYWLLLPLALLALFAFRRGVLALALCALLLPWPQAAHAQTHWWIRADQVQQRKIEQGVAAYRRGDYKAAEQAFSGLDLPDANYNRANALAKQGRYEEALAAYDTALRAQPRMDDAQANRRIVLELLKQKDKGGRGASKGQGEGKSQAQGTPSRQPAQQQGRPQDSPSRNPSQGTPQDDAEQRDASQDAQRDSRENAKAQQQADAAQRARMQQAMQQQAPRKPPQSQSQGATQAPRESAEERERRQATEAWLRRVPDDPGGLLRTKFRLEYERRQREGR